jgi:hypothetical protein
MSDDITDEFLNLVSKFSEVPVEYLRGDTAQAVWDSAQAAIDWKNAAQATGANAPVTSSAVNPNTHTPIRSQQLVPGDDWMAAWRAGRLTPLGAPAPPPRRNGSGHRDAGP